MTKYSNKKYYFVKIGAQDVPCQNNGLCVHCVKVSDRIYLPIYLHPQKIPKPLGDTIIEYGWYRTNLLVKTNSCVTSTKIIFHNRCNKIRKRTVVTLFPVN